MRDEPGRVLQGGLNLSLAMQTDEHGQVLLRVPKVGVREPVEHVWPEPVIVAAMRHIEETPDLLYATPGWERAPGHFQVHQFAEHTRPLPSASTTSRVPVPDHVVDNDIPVFVGKVARLTGLPAPARPLARNARHAAEHKVALLAAQWEANLRRSAALYRDLGFPGQFEEFIRPAWQRLSDPSDVPMVVTAPDIWRGNMLLHRDDKTVFVDNELLTITDPRSALAFMVEEGRYPLEQEERLVQRTREEVGIPGRRFDESLDGWRSLHVLTMALRYPNRRSRSFEDRTELGASDADIGREIAYMAEGNAAGIGRAMELLGRDAPSPEHVAWAYRREFERVRSDLRRSGRLDTIPNRPPGTARIAIPEGWQPDNRIGQYAFGTLTSKPQPGHGRRPGPGNPPMVNAAVSKGLSPMRAEERKPPLGSGVAPNDAHAGVSTWRDTRQTAEQAKGNELKLARSHNLR